MHLFTLLLIYIPHADAVAFYPSSHCNWLKDVARYDVTGFKLMAIWCSTYFSHQGTRECLFPEVHENDHSAPL